jgi:hypothetical protein
MTFRAASFLLVLLCQRSRTAQKLRPPTVRRHKKHYYTFSVPYSGRGKKIYATAAVWPTSNKPNPNDYRFCTSATKAIIGNSAFPLVLIQGSQWQIFSVLFCGSSGTLA